MSATDFTKPASQALTELIANAPNAEAIREICKSQSVADGILVRERGSGYDDTLTKEAENAVPANPSGASATSNFTFEREVRFAESTGRRSMVIRANSIADLDALENLVTR
jgi:hypothetical protein